MTNLKKVLWGTSIVGLVICGTIAYTIYNTIFSPNTGFDNDEAFLYIPSDASFADLKEQLAPLLKDVNAFEAVAERKGYSNAIKGGRYALKKGMNNNQIVNTLRSKNLPIRISFNNQETVFALAGRIAQQLEADSTALAASMTDAVFLTKNNFNNATKLGMYLPNTYEFFWNTGADEFRGRMLKEYQRFWNKDRLQKAERHNLTPNQVVTLASIVQKETVKVDERPRVAGVYLNRLKKGIALQADPTVIFAIKKETDNYDTIIKRVLFKDLELDSPYNTYKYGGLPPGPITMPDISSIEAVLNPEKHDYLFFVADVSNFGYHLFAKTLAQHNRNKAQYIRWLNNQRIRR